MKVTQYNDKCEVISSDKIKPILITKKVQTLNISYLNIDSKLKSGLNIFFRSILNKFEIFEDKNVEEDNVIIRVKYNNPGFLINPLYVKNSIKKKISPEILIHEIVINDYDFEK